MTAIPSIDLAWLYDVHGVTAQPENVVMLYGNEDYPDSVEVYDYDSFQSPCTVWKYQAGEKKMTVTLRVPGISKPAR